MTGTFSVKSGSREELIDITGEVESIVRKSGVSEGLCVVYTPHTTAAITINENADPSVRRDIIKGLSGIGLDGMRFSHAEGNSPAHIKSSLVGCSETVIISGGGLRLGTWQGIFFCEFDGPRSRNVMVQVM
jgi:secondary thiamine-phosphate synthase enzyme